MINPWIIIGWIVLILMSLPLVAIILYLTIKGLTTLIILFCDLLHIPCDNLYNFYETMK